MKALDTIVKSLLENMYTTRSLKEVSETLEELAEKASFRNHASAIVTDTNLKKEQKLTQLQYLIRGVEAPFLVDFFQKYITEDNIWLFSNDKLDYFDQFVQTFQMATEEMGVVTMTTAVPLNEDDLKLIAEDLSKSFGYKILIDHAVNPSLVGGTQLQIENLVYDFSLKTKFQQFEKQWLSSVAKTSKDTGRYKE